MRVGMETGDLGFYRAELRRRDGDQEGVVGGEVAVAETAVEGVAQAPEAAGGHGVCGVCVYVCVCVGVCGMVGYDGG